MPSGTFAVDGVVANRRFTFDAFILGNRLRHDRTLDHTGVEVADVVVLSTAIGPYPAGATVQSVLEDFVVRIGLLESSNRMFGQFTMDALIPAYFTANAVIKRVTPTSFTADAVITSAQKHFTLDAVVKEAGSPNFFTMDAFVV